MELQITGGRILLFVSRKNDVKDFSAYHNFLWTNNGENMLIFDALLAEYENLTEDEVTAFHTDEESLIVAYATNYTTEGWREWTLGFHSEMPREYFNPKVENAVNKAFPWLWVDDYEQIYMPDLEDIARDPSPFWAGKLFAIRHKERIERIIKEVRQG